MGGGGFLALRRTELAIVTEGQTQSTFSYDSIDRRALDAAVMVAHHREADTVWVWLRSSVRPPITFRDATSPPSSPVLWEVPAGLIEPGESAVAAATREMAEELGFFVSETAMSTLGPPAFPSPAVMGELHHFFHVEVDPDARREPLGDGSPVEDDPEVICVTLDEALAACRRGELRDGKTELALRRLLETLSEAFTG